MLCGGLLKIHPQSIALIPIALAAGINFVTPLHHFLVIVIKVWAFFLVNTVMDRKGTVHTIFGRFGGKINFGKNQHEAGQCY
jgi:hypothetical protein